MITGSVITYFGARFNPGKSYSFMIFGEGLLFFYFSGIFGDYYVC